MSKNLTRKGLALGAIVALGTSLFAGAPAFAGVESTGITLAPAAGTTYTSIAGASFDLSTVVNSNIETTTVKASKLSYLITNSAAAPLKFSFTGSGAAASNFFISSADAADNIAYASSADVTDLTAATAKAIVVSGKTGTNVGVNSSALTSNHLVVTSSTDATENVVVGVQAFIDENGNGKIDASDFVSPARTLTFIPAANVTATTTISSAVIGTTKLQVSVALGNDINQASIGSGKVFVQVKKDGTAVNFTGPVASTDATYDSTDAVLKNFATTVTSAITANTYVAQAYFGAALTAKLGAASNAAAPVDGALSADSTDFVDVTASANVKKGTTGNASNTATVRSGYTGNVTFTSKVTWHSNDNTEKAAPAGVTVRVTLTKVALATASTFTAGGKTLTATSGAQTFTVLTDADGAISFTGAGTGASSDSVEVGIEVLKKTGGYSSIGRKITVTYALAAVNALVNTDLVGGSAVRKIAAGATYTANYTVADQFGQASAAAGSYRVAVSATGGTSAFAYYAPVVAGKATQSVVDNSTTAGTYTLRARLQKLNATSLAWEDQLSNVDQTVVVNAIAASAVSGAASSSAAVATITKSLVTADLRVDANSQTQTTIGYGSSATQTISGTVTDATGAAVSGAVVTVTGAGLAFVVNNNVYSVGSATINTGTNGQYSVDVYSTTAGKTSVVVTSGAATKSVAIEFSGVTALLETNVVSIDVASLSQVGRSVTATVKVVDKFANPVSGVAVAVSVTGVGSLSAATVTTGTAGTATVQFVAGANDFGDAVITAKYTATDAAATVLSATKTLTIGMTDAQIDIVGKRVTAVASFSKGKTVAFYVDGVKKWSKLSASDADVVLNYNLKKGTHTVTVKISGGLTTTERFIVK